VRGDPSNGGTSRAAIQQLIDAVSIPLAVTDSDGRVVRANLGFAEACGLSLEELLERNALDLLEWPLEPSMDLPASVIIPPVWRLRSSSSRPEQAGTTTWLRTDRGPMLLLQLSVPEGGTSADLMQSIEQAMRVQEVAVALSQALTVHEVTDVMLTEAATALGSSGFLISLLDGNGVLSPVRVEGYDAEMQELIRRRIQDREGAPMQAVLDRRPLVFASPEDYLARFPGREELVRHSGMQAWVYLPLMASGRVIGAWSVSYAERRATSPADLALLTTLAVLCAQTLERARLYEREHEMASVLQRAIAPGELPALPGVQFGARYLPATVGSEVGGDFFDVVPLPGRRVMVLLGDVVGHDIRAAAVMGQVRATLRAYAALGGGPADVLRRTNDLASEYAGPIATCCCLEMDLATGVVTMARAGHPPPLLLGADGRTELLEVPGGVPLGAGPGVDYPLTRVLLSRDDVLLLYTDGLVETRTRPLDLGLSQLTDAAAETEIRSPDALVEHLLRELAPERHPDDIALLAMQRKPAAPPRAILDAASN